MNMYVNFDIQLLFMIRNYMFYSYILGVLMQTTTSDWHWRDDETL